MIRLHAVVMAGGKGTRFWPESTSKKPKQYLGLLSDKTLLQETLERFDGLVPPADRVVVTVEEQKELALQSSAGKASEAGPIFEPEGRNTAPCLLLAALELLKRGASPTDIMAIVPSDHVILNGQGFRDTISKAAEMAQKEAVIVTIGIPPHFPHTGFGYIQRGDKVVGETYRVLQFKEKPNLETAVAYLKSGQYFWNAGMFVVSIHTLLGEFKEHAPEIAGHTPALQKCLGDAAELQRVYGQIPSNSIDYAIMEKSRQVRVIRAEFDWNDLGSWDALESVLPTEQDNTFVGHTGAKFVSNAKGNIVFAPDQFVSLVDVNDLIVIANGTSVTVLPKCSSQKVKEIVDHIKRSGNTRLKELI